MDTIYTMLAKNITESEKALFGNLSFYDMGFIRQSFVTGYKVDSPYDAGLNLRKSTIIDIHQLLVLSGGRGLSQDGNMYIVQRLSNAPNERDCIKIVAFQRPNVDNPDLMYNMIPNNASIESTGIVIAPYAKDVIETTKVLRDTIVVVNHIIQITLMVGRFGINLPFLIQTILSTVFPKSHYVATYQSTPEYKTIQVLSNKTALFEVVMDYDMTINFNTGTEYPAPLSRLIKLHNLRIAEVDNVGLFIYLSCVILNAILSKRTIYVNK